PVLHVDESGEGQVRQRRPAVGRVLHQSEEDPIGGEHLTALHEREPVVELLRQRALDVVGRLIGPVGLRHRRRLVHLDVVQARVVPGRLADELVPRVEPVRHVPDGLGHRQHRQLGPHHRGQRQADALAQQAVVVVHELDHAVVETLVVGHVGVGRVDAHSLAGDLGEGPSLLEEAVQRLAGAELIAGEDAFFQTGVLGGRHAWPSVKTWRQSTIAPMTIRLALGGLLALLLFLTAYPLAMLVYGSLHTTPPGEAGSFNLDGYRAMLSSANARVLLNTVGLSLVKTGLAMTLALFLAWIVARTDTPYRDTLEVLITLPFYIPPILTAMAWGMLATPKGGLINLAWTALTGRPEPLVNIYSYGGVVWHMMQYSTPFLFLLMVGAFKSMDPALEESSRMSGASSWTTFRRVTLGLMLPVTTSAFILSFIRGVESFESALVFGTPAGIEVITTEIYHLIHHVSRPDYPQATALALGMMALMFGLLAWQWRLLAGRSFFTVTGKGYTPRVTRLGRWRWATFAFCVLFFVVTVVLPVSQLVVGSFFKFFGFYRMSMLTVDHYSAVWNNRLVWRALGNTML